jgi:hypothetical protein
MKEWLFRGTLRYLHYSHSFTSAKAYVSANRETIDLGARVSRS